jgi:hypothetical protein
MPARSGRLKENCGPDQPGPKSRPFSKITRAKRAGGTNQVVKYLPTKYDALSSNPILPNK